MVICTVEVNEKAPQTIVIGRRGTYNTQEVVFDIGYLIDVYGAGTAVLAIKRSQDSSAYPTVVTQEDTALTWTVSETDTYYVGAGECQLMWYVDDGLAKTIIYPTVVMKDILSTAEEPPDGYENWIEHLTDLGAETLQNAQNAAQSASDAESAKDDTVTAKEAAEEAAETAQEAVVHAPIIQGGYWYIWNNGQYVDTGVRAEGQKGDQGDPGEKGDTGNGIASITKTGTSGLVDTYTVTYTDGTTTTFTVTNGAKGDKGDTGATGNGIQSITKTGTSGNVDTYTITYTNGQTTTFTVTNGAVSSVAGKTGAVTLDANDVAFFESGTYDDGTVGKELSDQKNAIDTLESDIDQKAPLIINTASGDVASFADGADGMQIRKIVGTIVPQQDLHGYDAPWPAGGGVNKLDDRFEIGGISSSTGDNVSQSTTIRTIGYSKVTSGETYRLSVPPSTSAYLFWYSTDNTSGYMGNSGGYLISGNVIVPDGANYLRIQMVSNYGTTYNNNIAFNNPSTVTTYSPYSNECPISGWTGANITGTATNLCGGESLADGLLATYPNAVKNETDKTVSFGYAGSANPDGLGVKFKENTQYTFIFAISNSSVERSNMAIMYTDGTQSFVPDNGVRINTKTVVVAVSTANKTVRGLYRKQSGGTTYIYYEESGVFEGVHTAADFVPYVGQTLPINWQTEAGTIYGGSITLNEDGSADVVADCANYHILPSDWSYQSSVNAWYVSRGNLSPLYLEKATGATGFYGICDGYPFAPSYANLVNNPLPNHIAVRNDGNAKAIYCMTDGTGDTRPIETNIVLKVAEPVTYHFDNIGELYTYLGTNNVWIDTGAITECDYPADTKLYIDNKIATAIANALNA